MMMPSMLTVNEDAIFKAFEGMLEDQNVNPYSELTQELQENHEQLLTSIDRVSAVDLSNLCVYISGSAVRDGFRLGFNAAMQMVDVIQRTERR